jgi:hypothetical protein
MRDSEPIRAALHGDPGATLAIVVSDSVFRLVVLHCYAGLDPDRFHEVRVVVKQYDRQAWLSVRQNERLRR